MEPSRLSDTALHALDESGSDFDTDLPRGSAARGERKSRNSFSFGDFIPSPSPSTWKKSRGGSLKRKKGRDGVATDRRIVSAPQQSSQGQKNKKYSNKPNHDKGSSSPLPPLEQFSAFEVDLPGTSSSNRTGSMGEEQLLASYQDGPFTSPSPNHGGQTTARVRSSSRRASRVPSDPSTTFGSDNEQSRVFSTDGEEGDFRSETAYDSLRTEASGSSHSGARNHRVDAVFGDQTPPDSLKQNSVAFQEKLARVSLMGYRKPEDFIAEEEGVQTPTHGQDQSETGSSTTVAPLKRQSSPVFASSSSDSTGTRSNDTVNVNGRDAASRGEKNQALKSESMPDIEEDDWDDEFGIESATTAEQSRNHITNPLSTAEALPSDLVALPERPKSNIFEWSERQLPEKGVESGSSLRPRTAHPQQTIERGGRPSGRRPPSGMHLRSQSVPLPPENSKHRFNSSAKLDSWKLGSKGESERWDNDFEFDEPSPIAQDSTNEESTAERVVVPKDILEKQASVHGQFGHVKELTLLVEELRRLHHQGGVHGILNGQSSGLWKEAEGIIDLATLDEDEPLHSANSTSFEFDTFDEDSPTLAGRQRKSSATQSRRESQGQKESSPATQPASFPSPAGSRQGTPKGRPRQDSVARAKNVLETINQFRSPLEPSLEPVEEHVLSSSPSKKMPFDTTSLRDLVTRAGVVTRALKEIIRRIEDPEYVPHTPERRSQSPPDPPFVSQIFYQNSPQPSPSPSNDRKNPSVTERSGGGLAIGSLSGHDNEVHGHSHGHAHMMTVV
ncbi:hypothetical protein MMC10_004178 [Thelotrema lepadinum]|nr:hypothetical protein [Thelotrema lepadinum]